MYVVITVKWQPLGQYETFYKDNVQWSLLKHFEKLHNKCKWIDYMIACCFYIKVVYTDFREYQVHALVILLFWAKLLTDI